MKHVFVETNFLIELLRPLASEDAKRLFDRNGRDVDLHLPWVSVGEARRTMTRIVAEDLGFDAKLLSLAGQEFRRGGLSSAQKSVLDDFATRLAHSRASALRDIETRIDQAAAKMRVIPPSQPVITKTLSLYPVKALHPFDEMVLGAVLARAEELHQAGERDLHFCNLNTKDFSPKPGTPLEAAYLALALRYHASFAIP